MKKILFFSLMLLANCTFGQLTVAGEPIPVPNPSWINSVPGTTYNLLPPTASTRIWTRDPGTNVYVWYHGSLVPTLTAFVEVYIIRIGGYWHFAQHADFPPSSGGGSSDILRYKYVLPSTDIDPPCYGATTIGISTTPGPAFSITGTTCSGPPAPLRRATVMTPDATVLPRMTTVEITAIAAPTSGMMVFDINTLKIKVYNGFAWKSITVE